MTVSSEISRNDRVGTGFLDTFIFEFEIYVKTDIKVWVDGVPKYVDTHFTVPVAGINNPAGGTIVFTGGNIPILNAKIAIILDLPLTQLTNYVEGDKFPAETHETALDRLVKLAQAANETYNRCLRLPPYSVGSGVLPTDFIANYFMKVNSTGDGFELHAGLPYTSPAGANKEIQFNDVGILGADSDLTWDKTYKKLYAREIIVRSPWIDVRHPDFGAKGDGVTDDTAAIVAALAAGGNIFLPDGIYYYTSNLVATNKNISGIPGRSVLKPSAAVTIALAIQSSSDGASGSRYPIKVSGLELDGVLTTGKTGLKIGSNANIVANASFEDITIKRFLVAGGIGLLTDSFVNCNFKNVNTMNNQVGTKFLTSGAVSLPTTSTFINCYFRANLEEGMLMDSGNLIKFYGCIFENNRKNGAKLIPTLGAGGDIKHIIFDNCDFEDNWYDDGARTAKFAVDIASDNPNAYCYLPRFNNCSWNINVATEKAICFNDVIGGIIDNPWVCNIADSISIVTRNVSFHNLVSGYDWGLVIDPSGGAIPEAGLLSYGGNPRGLIYKINTLANNATPWVGYNGNTQNVYLTGGTTTITDFIDGVPGQEIKIISEHAITITDGTNIFLNGSTNFVMKATDALTLIQKADGKWYEMGRSVN
jgi:hypothetical protein